MPARDSLHYPRLSPNIRCAGIGYTFQFVIGLIYHIYHPAGLVRRDVPEPRVPSDDCVQPADRGLGLFQRHEFD